MEADELQWDPPGPGLWFASSEHMPAPMSGLMAELLPLAGRGWAQGSERYGLPPNTGTFGVVNCWGYYSPGVRGAVDLDAMERVAAESLATRRWRTELQRWREEVRPAVVAANRRLLAVDLGRLTDEELAAHVQDALDGFARFAPEHFASFPHGGAAMGALLQATGGWGLDPQQVLLALTGASDASSSAERLLDRIAAGLRAAGVEPTDLMSIRVVGGDTAAALDELLVDYGWRPFGADLVEPTLAERPDAVVAAVRAALAGSRERARPDVGALAALREQVPEADRPSFDGLVVDAREGYGNNDDNTVVLFSLPLGLVRRAALEVGRRLAARGGVHEVDDILDARPDELVALARGDAGPTADELAARRAFRADIAGVTPPPTLGTPPPPQPELDLPPSVRALAALLDALRAWASSGDGTRAQATVGTEVVRGRAVVVVDPLDAAVRMEPGDVLVALTTSAPFNTIFPIAGAVAVQVGSIMSHAAVLARELGLTAVIGVPDLLTRVADGDLVEVDPVAGTIRVIEPTT